jgi:hypothetical protein
VNAMKRNSGINQPKISDETMKEMAKFFMKTSIPRIMAEMAKKEGDLIAKRESERLLKISG